MASIGRYRDVQPRSIGHRQGRHNRQPVFADIQHHPAVIPVPASVRAERDVGEQFGNGAPPPPPFCSRFLTRKLVLLRRHGKDPVWNRTASCPMPGSFLQTPAPRKSSALGPAEECFHSDAPSRRFSSRSTEDKRPTRTAHLRFRTDLVPVTASHCKTLPQNKSRAFPPSQERRGRASFLPISF